MYKFNFYDFSRICDKWIFKFLAQISTTIGVKMFFAILLRNHLFYWWIV